MKKKTAKTSSYSLEITSRENVAVLAQFYRKLLPKYPYVRVLFNIRKNVVVLAQLCSISRIGRDGATGVSGVSTVLRRRIHPSARALLRPHGVRRMPNEHPQEVSGHNPMSGVHRPRQFPTSGTLSSPQKHRSPQTPPFDLNPRAAAGRIHPEL